MPPTHTQPLSQTLIERTLDRLQFPHRPTATGDRVSNFGDLEDQIGSLVRVWFMVEDPSIFRVLAAVGLRVPAAKVSGAMRACSEYPAHFSFGRVGLLFHEGEGTGEASLYFDSQILLLHGASEQLLGSFIMSNVGNAIAFFQHAWDQGLYTACQPTPSRKNGRSSSKRK